MGSEKSLSLEEKVVDSSSEPTKIIQWEDLEQELARLWSLSSALNKAKEKKSSLELKLQSLIQLRAEALSRSNELEERRQKLEARKLAMDDMSMRSKLVVEDVKKREGRLSVEIKTILVAGKALSVASKQLQEANRLLAGERGLVHLKNLQRMRGKRQQYMIAQIALLYPVKSSIELTHGEKLDSSSNGSRSGDSAGSKPLNLGPLTISGLRLTALPLKKASFFSDKKEVQKYASALGYIAHAVSLIASYLDVPLRYPLLFGGSRSYVNDYVSSVDPMPSDSTSSSLLATVSKPTEFPLFLEGQDITRAAYAIFLLNKDIEQLLNFIGVNSLGPRHVLANLKELLRSIQSQEYIDKI
ncbi:UV radiation resistance-associated gene protein isoform X2 [Telopea speciosissima]|uniref:UV radiation resistance-associated gene protein isoform X2 n=1 Tax=Telopea speciosissima TaxID=54955 RepID=UPI001CC58670|nr:UV radiation resistance-associated gene protein isoform X2 [Telopea speciosissima]